MNSSDPSPWFSHQHHPLYLGPSTLVLFDNGNTRRASDPNAHSRGQVWKLDEHARTATLVFNGPPAPARSHSRDGPPRFFQ